MLITAIATVSGSWLVARTTGRTAAREVEIKARDSDRAARVADREEMRELRGEIDKLWQARRDDAIVIRGLGDFIDVLEAHIWERKPPPPPKRPKGI